MNAALCALEEAKMSLLGAEGLLVAAEGLWGSRRLELHRCAEDCLRQCRLALDRTQEQIDAVVYDTTV